MLTMSTEPRYIKSLSIKGYKKFEDFKIDFQPGLNVLVGENSIGKSTILEAINIALNQYYFSNNQFGEQQSFNLSMQQRFFNHPNFNDLPKISIEVELALPCDTKTQFFAGVKDDEVSFGVKFEYKPDMNFEDELRKFDFEKNHILPLEYYHATWTTFSERTYKRFLNPLKMITVDSSANMYDIYGNYARSIFQNKFNDGDKRKLLLEFKNSMRSFLNRNDLNFGNQYEFSVDEKKASLEQLLEIRNEGISLRNRGKGEENLIKTELALQKQTNLNVVMIEEPENHLSYSNTRKQLKKILEEEHNVDQLIVTTHESMILNQLNIKRAIWITEEHQGYTLSSLSDEDAAFFAKSDNFDILSFILGERIILVEGNSEFIFLPKMLECNNREMDKQGISIIAMRGIYYKHFRQLAKILKKRTLVITDNDGERKKLNNLENDEYFKVVMPKKLEDFTLEKVLFETDQDNFKKVVDLFAERKTTTTKWKSHENLDPYVVRALNNKTMFALKLTEHLENGGQFKMPEYLMEGIEWLVK